MLCQRSQHYPVRSERGAATKEGRPNHEEQQARLESHGGVQLHSGQRGLQVSKTAIRRGCVAKIFISYSLYTFDTRKLQTPLKVHFDHVSAVTDVDYSPTGKEFVSASYDKTIRIYNAHHSHSRDIYHTKRMQHVVCVAWSLDNRYVFSGSDEMNVRMWKANASEKLGVIRPRERVNFNYQEALKQKYAAHPQIKRIARHRQVPRHVLNAQKKMRTVKEKEQVKEANVRKHTKKSKKVPYVSEKKKHVLKEEVWGWLLTTVVG